MYSNESVQKLTDSLTRRADRASEVVEELDRLDSPSLPAAKAKSREAQDALAVVQAWAKREELPDPTPAPTEVDELKEKIAALKAENARLRELLGVVDGHAGEIVSALAGEVSE
jgi:uncharacterized small protein (DUF1192 family)